jgi:N utilization substance protein B
MQSNKSKKINNRRKSRELIMKSIYRGIVNQFDVAQIKKDIKDDPDFNRADEEFYNQIFGGVSENINDLQAEIQTYLDRDLSELSPIELSIIYGALYELKFFPEVPYRVVINEAIEIAKAFGGSDGFKFINGVLNKAAKENRKEEFLI